MTRSQTPRVSLAGALSAPVGHWASQALAAGRQAIRARMAVSSQR
ncbi:hypothetical protein [Dechloromonas denitrificans]|nr:hypothetical protein [Dechloromonas denitrificans]